MLKLDKINKYYRNSDNVSHVLKNVSLNVDEGEMIAIMGPSGSGKSTLINILGFIDTDYEGQYLINNESYKNVSDNTLAELRNKKVGFIFQNFNLIENNTILENLSLPLRLRNISSKKINLIIVDLLKKMNLEDKINDYPKYLSGGQQQRIAIARALINNPDVIIADEPTGSLDEETAHEIMKLLKRINIEQNSTIIIVTHDIEITQYCNRVINIKNGEIIVSKKDIS